MYGIAGSLGTSMLSFLKNLHNVLPSGYIHLHFHPQLGGFSSLHTFCRVYCCGFFEMVILIDVRWCLFGQLICLSLRISDAKHRFMCFMAISMPSLEKVHIDPWPIFYWIVCFLMLFCGSCSYVVETHSRGIFICKRFSILRAVFFFHCKCPLLCKCFKRLLSAICLFLFYLSWF